MAQTHLPLVNDDDDICMSRSYHYTHRIHIQLYPYTVICVKMWHSSIILMAALVSKSRKQCINFHTNGKYKSTAVARESRPFSACRYV